MCPVFFDRQDSGHICQCDISLIFQKISDEIQIFFLIIRRIAAVAQGVLQGLLPAGIEYLELQNSPYDTTTLMRL